MEERQNRKPHSIFWKDRKQGSITGVNDVLSFDEEMVVLKTDHGTLTLKGKGLHVGKLSLEQGELELEGEIQAIAYSGSHPGNKGSLVKRMFR